jgi:hypothetical protein
VTLVPFSSVDLAALRWLKVADAPMVFTLSSGDRPLAQLRWAGRSGSLAHAETDRSRWTLKRSGFLNPHVTLRSSEGGSELARISVHFNYHAVQFTDGTSFRFHRAGYLVPAWQVTDPAGTELVHLEPVREGRVLTGGAVLVSTVGAQSAHLGPLLCLCWYFVALAWFEDEALVPFEHADAT